MAVQAVVRGTTVRSEVRVRSVVKVMVDDTRCAIIRVNIFCDTCMHKKVLAYALQSVYYLVLQLTTYVLRR